MMFFVFNSLINVFISCLSHVSNSKLHCVFIFSETERLKMHTVYVVSETCIKVDNKTHFEGNKELITI